MKETRKQSLGYLNTGIFRPIILFSCGYDFDEIIDVLKKTGAEEWIGGIKDERNFIQKGHAYAMQREVDGIFYYYIIIRDSFDFEDESYCTLAHEVLHIVQFVLLDILDRDREFECEAYLHTHIMSQCLQQIRGK